MLGMIMLLAMGGVTAMDRVDEQLAMLRHADAYVRGRAARILSRLGDTRAIGPLISALADEDSGVRLAATESLVSFGESAVDALMAALMDKRLRPYAVGVLRDLGYPVDTTGFD